MITHHEHTALQHTSDQIADALIRRTFNSANNKPPEEKPPDILNVAIQMNRDILSVLERFQLIDDGVTFQHSMNVGYILKFFQGYTGCPPLISVIIGMLHDVGKLYVPRGILNKGGKLSVAEFKTMRKHPIDGARIIDKIFGFPPKEMLLKREWFSTISLVSDAARYHHARWDGSGYPTFEGKNIPLIGRIVAIADVFDALTSSRPYKEAWPTEKALDVMQEESGKHFDPDLLEYFVEEVCPLLKKGQTMRQLKLKKLSGKT